MDGSGASELVVGASVVGEHEALHVQRHHHLGRLLARVEVGAELAGDELRELLVHPGDAALVHLDAGSHVAERVGDGTDVLVATVALPQLLERRGATCDTNTVDRLERHAREDGHGFPPCIWP